VPTAVECMYTDYAPARFAILVAKLQHNITDQDIKRYTLSAN